MLHSILIIGQSNMAGRGFFDEKVDIDESRIKVMRNGRWWEFFRPVNPDRPFSGVCLAESFAEKYAGKFGVDVGIIPCADGGTSLEQWKEGSLLFDNAVNCARLASRTSHIAAVLWHQGEADSHDHLWPTYRERFEKIVSALRREAGLENVPFIVGGLGDFVERCEMFPELKNFRHVNAALRETAEHDPMMGFASAEGLTSNPDSLHFNAKSLHEFGGRYFDQFLKIYDPERVFADKPGMDDAIRSEMEKL